MAIQTKPNRFKSLLVASAIILFAAVYSCNNGTDKKDEPAATKDTTAAPTPAVTTDTTKTDTSGKGTQTPPPPPPKQN